MNEQNEHHETPKNLSEDPRLTAFALGELPADEHAAFERELETEPAAQAEVESIRAMAGIVEVELRQEPAATLTDSQRAAVKHEATRRRAGWRPWLVAASIGAAAFGGYLVRGAVDEARMDDDLSDLIVVRHAPGNGDQLDLSGRADGFNALNNPSLTNPSSVTVVFATSVNPESVIDNSGPGLEAGGAAADPESGTFFNDGADGDFRARPGGGRAGPGGGAGGGGGSYEDDGDAVEPWDMLRRVASEPANRLEQEHRGKSDAGEAFDAEATLKQGIIDQLTNEHKDANDAKTRVLQRIEDFFVEENIASEHKNLVRDKNRQGSALQFASVNTRARLQGTILIGGKNIALGREVWRAVRPDADEGPNREGYDALPEIKFKRVLEEDTSTFSIDVDTASYANVRRLLNGGRMPPKGAVRIEEMINYFDYEYAGPGPRSEHPFAANVEIAECPWEPKHRLARIAIQGERLDMDKRPATNIVFLVDVSGSMSDHNKLPLLVNGLKLLVKELDKRDKVSIVVYAGAAGQVLEPTAGDNQAAILAALDNLSAGGSTNGGAGIQLAYKIAEQNFVKQGVNRVILATDGDFNVGISDRGGLKALIEEKAKSKVYLSVLGFGTGNYRDGAMEELSNSGNGNYAYIDTIKEAQKVLVQQMGGTLVTIAKDVKIQIFFNPRKVLGYRLIGYANRRLNKQDFNDDKKDAGDIGAGHSVTALYELIPTDGALPGPRVDANPFITKPAAAGVNMDALFQLRLRYKMPDAETSTLLEANIVDQGEMFAGASKDYQWSAAVAAFGMLLRDSRHRGHTTYGSVLEIAGAAKGADKHGYRAEFLEIVKRAQAIAAQKNR